MYSSPLLSFSSPSLIYIFINGKQNGRKRKHPILPNAHILLLNARFPCPKTTHMLHVCRQQLGSRQGQKDTQPPQCLIQGPLMSNTRGLVSIACVQFLDKCTQQCTEAAIVKSKCTMTHACVQRYTQNSVCSRLK